MTRSDDLVLRRVNPLTKLVVAILYVVLVTVVFDPLVQAAVLALFAAVLLVLERIRLAALAKAMIPFALVGFGYLWVNVFFHESTIQYGEALPGTALFADPGIDAGVTLFLRALSFGTISFAFVRATPPTGLVESLMQHARLPPHVAFSIFTGLQLLPQLGSDLRQIERAHALRLGRKVGLVRRLTTVPRRAIPLIATAIRKASRAALSMEARGLRRGMSRTTIHPSTFGRPDAVFALAAALSLVAVAGLGVWRHLS